MRTVRRNESEGEGRKSYIVHMTLKDNEDGELFVIENEFLSDNWISAWHHVMGLPNKFSATLVSHRLREVEPKTGKLIDQPKTPAIGEVKMLPAPHRAKALASAPAPTTPPWKCTITVNFPTPVTLNV